MRNWMERERWQEWSGWEEEEGMGQQALDDEKGRFWYGYIEDGVGMVREVPDYHLNQLIINYQFILPSSASSIGFLAHNKEIEHTESLQTDRVAKVILILWIRRQLINLLILMFPIGLLGVITLRIVRCWRFRNYTRKSTTLELQYLLLSYRASRWR